MLVTVENKKIHQVHVLRIMDMYIPVLEESPGVFLSFTGESLDKIFEAKLKTLNSNIESQEESTDGVKLILNIVELARKSGDRARVISLTGDEDPVDKVKRSLAEAEKYLNELKDSREELYDFMLMCGVGTDKQQIEDVLQKFKTLPKLDDDQEVDKS
jgi:hypothetical protein